MILVSGLAASQHLKEELFRHQTSQEMSLAMSRSRRPRSRHYAIQQAICGISKTMLPGGILSPNL